MSDHDSGPADDALATLDAHGVHLSDADEREITTRTLEAEDVGLFALRTCRCGARIDGFDAYAEHLREAFSPGT